MKDYNHLKCPISKTNKFRKIFTLKKFPIFMGVEKEKHKIELKDMNFYVNKLTGTVQIFPRVPLKKLYYKPHGSGKIGSTWEQHHNKFFKYLKNNLKGKIVEIGGGHNSLINNFKKIKINNNCKIISFEPNPSKKKLKNHKIIKKFFDNNSVKNSNIKKCDLVIHSHLFEHIYDPSKFLNLIKKILDYDGYHMFSIPNMKKMIQNNQSNAMNFEHPYYLEEELIDELLNSSNFEIINKTYFKDHSIFYKTKLIKRKKEIKYNKYLKNYKIFKNYKKKLDEDIIRLNNKIKNKHFFLFGAHIFSQNLIFNNLKTNMLLGILDNDKDKQNNFLYGTKIRVLSPDILRKYKKPIIVVRTGTYNSEIKKQIKLINKNSIIL